MKWFDKWLLKKIKAASTAGQNAVSSDSRVMDSSLVGSSGYYGNSKLNPISKSINQLDSGDRAIRFSVYNANGGRVVETRKTDYRHDREITGLYIITRDQNFGDEIDKIITLESLKNG